MTLGPATPWTIPRQRGRCRLQLSLAMEQLSHNTGYVHGARKGNGGLQLREQGVKAGPQLRRLRPSLNLNFARWNCDRRPRPEQLRAGPEPLPIGRALSSTRTTQSEIPLLVGPGQDGDARITATAWPGPTTVTTFTEARLTSGSVARQNSGTTGGLLFELDPELR